MVTVLKLGGSVITEKDSPETVDHERLGRAVSAIAGADASGLVLVHGGGSFGHHHAAKHGVSTTAGTGDATAVTEIHRAMGDLNATVVDALHEEGVSAVPVRPLSVASRDGGLQFPLQQVASMLGEGFVPVLHGDVVTTVGEGGTVLSGDEIVVTVAATLDAARVGLCSTVPGVLDDDGSVVERIESYDQVASVLGGSDATDVSGGMAGKIRQLLELDAPASVFDLDGLEPFFASGKAGTVVDG
jgi:isopentenyl phosphate kinase